MARTLSLGGGSGPSPQTYRLRLGLRLEITVGTMAYATIMDLFVEGDVASAEGKDGKVIPVWVNKLSSFEKEDADRLARGARAKAILAWDRDDDEQAIFDYETEKYTDAELVEALAGQVDGKYYFEAVVEIRTLPAWTDRLAYLTNAEILESGSAEASDEDRALFAEVTAEYMAAVEEIKERKLADHREELAANDREWLMEKYKQAWRDAQGMRAFYEERRIAEIFFAARECKAVFDSGEWQHRKCNHEVRLMSNRGQVRGLPESLRVAIVGVLERLDMPAEDAGNSDAPMASSGSSEPQSALEDSTPSSPAATSDEPAGT